VATHLPQPSIDALFARRDPGSADARVFGKDTFNANRPYMYCAAIILEKQPVSRTNAEESGEFRRAW